MRNTVNSPEHRANRRECTVALSELCSGSENPNGFDDLIMLARKTLMRTFHDIHLVDDAIQETMIDVLRYSDRFQNAENRLAYFLTAARHQAIGLMLKDKKRRKVVSQLPYRLDTEDRSEEGLAEEKVICEENRLTYQHHLQQLENGQSPHHAKILQWRLEFDDSHQEIAKKLRGRMTEHVVRGMWSKLSKKLMETLDIE